LKATAQKDDAKGKNHRKKAKKGSRVCGEKIPQREKEDRKGVWSVGHSIKKRKKKKPCSGRRENTKRPKEYAGEMKKNKRRTLSLKKQQEDLYYQKKRGQKRRKGAYSKHRTTADRKGKGNH